jgi:hypothetical protein
MAHILGNLCPQEYPGWYRVVLSKRRSLGWSAFSNGEKCAKKVKNKQKAKF